MPAPLEIGLLGCGLWGRRILADLLALGAQVRVVDVDPAARAAASAAGATSSHADIGAADEAHAWVVATPASAHLSSLSALANSGLPVLCEKPLCLDVAQARAIAALPLQRCHLLDVWRYHPAVEALAGLVRAGTLGDVHGLRSTRINWTSPRTDVDSLLNLAPHEVSIYREVFGALPHPQAAHFEWHGAEVRGAWLRWSGGPWLLSELGNRSPLRRREMRLHGSEAVALWDAGQPLSLLIAAGAADQELEAGERRLIALDPQPALRRQLAAWLAWLQEDGPAPRSDLAHGIAAIEAIQVMRGLGAPP